MWNQEKADELIPNYMHGGLKRYIEMGIEPGGFLMAVLENDLKTAVGQAYHINMTKLPDYARFLYNYAPSTCWGSEAKVAAWIDMHEKRLHAQEESPGGRASDG